MRAVAIYEHGGIEKLTLTDLPKPTAGADEVVIRVHAVALNRLDIFVREGLPGLKLPLPHVLGSDVAGVIDEVGASVRELTPGQRVTINPGISCGRCEFCAAGFGSQCTSYAMVGENRDGAYAELVAVPAHIVLPIPDSISFEEAAAAPLVFLTAWSMMVTKGNIRPGEDVLILGDRKSVV